MQNIYYLVCVVRWKELNGLPNLNEDYEEFPYVPMLKYELDKLVERAYSTSLHLADWKLPDKLDIFMIKANNFISIRLRALRQSVDSVLK